MFSKIIKVINHFIVLMLYWWPSFILGQNFVLNIFHNYSEILALIKTIFFTLITYNLNRIEG